MILALAFLTVLIIGGLLGVAVDRWWDRRRPYPRRPNPYWDDDSIEQRLDDLEYRARDVP
jgi:hypothetical protein